MKNTNESPTLDPAPDSAANSSRGRTGMIAGVSAGLLGGAVAGLIFAMPGATSAAEDKPVGAAVFAQVDDTSTPPTDGPPSAGDRVALRTERIRTSLDELVTDGTVTSEQADAVAEHLATQAPDRGPGGPGGHDGPRGPRHIDGAILDLLGVDAETLREALESGATLAEVAEFNGVSTQELIDAMVFQASERLDDAVENGRLTEAEAAEKLAEITERITERVTSTPGTPGDG